MLLIPISNLSIKEQKVLGSASFKKDFNAGWQMTDFMMNLDKKIRKMSAEGSVYWHSNHHQILIWVTPENEKYLTYLLMQ